MGAINITNNFGNTTSAELEYGVIYVFSNLYVPNQLLTDYLTTAGRVCGQSEAMQRFRVEVAYVNQAPTLMARRFNAGNIGKKAVVTCPVCGDINIDGIIVNEFVRTLFDFNSIENGDHHIKTEDFLTAEQKQEWQDSLERPDLNAKLEHARTQAEALSEPIEKNRDPQDPEERELSEAERLRKRYLTIVGQLVINYVALTHGDPHELLGDTLHDTPIIFAAQQLSPLVIDQDLKIRLTQYGNAEIRLHPLSKALYILFLLHPEGIELNRIDEHRQELEQIYNIIMPVRDDEATVRIIDNVVNPLSGTLNQNLSRIKRFFKTVIMDDTIARQYYIGGNRGEAYRISLPRQLATVPKVFSGLD